jgi:hypothetical protein
MATLTNVAVVQAGTGLAGEDAATNTVLINNTAKWQATYQITAPGSVTLTATLPMNNTFDAASVASGAGCGAGSALSKSSDSQTNNIATCIINPTTAGMLDWVFSAAVWGANGDVVQPTLAISGVSQSQPPPAVNLKGAPNYGLALHLPSETPAYNGVNTNIRIGFGLYAPLSATGGVTGLEPIKDGRYSFTVDTTNFPVGWSIRSCIASSESNKAPLPSGGGINAVVNSGTVSCSKASDGSSLTFTISGAAIGVAHYPTYLGNNGSEITGRAFYSIGMAIINTPVSSLTPTNQTFRAFLSDFPVVSKSDQIATVTPDVTSLSWVLNNLASGRPRLWFYAPLPIGWNTGVTNSLSLLPSATLNAAMTIQLNVVPTSDHADNLYYCATWNPSQVAVTGPPMPNTRVSDGIGSEPLQYEFGVIGTGMNGRPDPAAGCGQYGDGASTFFGSLPDAQNYAASQGLYINAVRIYIARIPAGIRDLYMALMPMQVTPNNQTSTVLPSGTAVTWRAIATTDQWSNLNEEMTSHYAVGGIVRNTVEAYNSTANSPSVAVGGTEHITITPYAYGVDTNVTETVTIPAGLTPVVGSYQWNGGSLTPAITVNGDGSQTLVFSLGTVGSDTANDTAQPAVTFDVVVDSNVTMPTNMTIAAQTGGYGTSRTLLGWRQASVQFAVSAQISFGYTASQSAAVIEIGDSLTYNFADYNTMTEVVHGLDEVIVLPYNGDGRGTTDVDSYRVSELVVTTAGGGGLTLQYTTDAAVRGDPGGGGITWTSYSSGALPAGITAVRWTAGSLNPGATESVRLSLTDIMASDNAILATDITYVAVDEVGVMTNQSLLTATYKAAYVTLGISSDNLAFSIAPTGDGASASGFVTITTTSNNPTGYQLTVSTDDSDLICRANNSYILPSMSGTGSLETNRWGYSKVLAEDIDGSAPTSWQAVPVAPLAGTLENFGSQAKTGRRLELYIGAKANFSLPACKYGGTVVVTGMAGS